MRLISEDGRIDLPYDRVVLEIETEEPDAEIPVGAYTIVAYDTTGIVEDCFIMGVYFDEKDALDVMKQVRFAFQRSCHWFDFGAIQKRPNDLCGRRDAICQ